jgi:hypothetical protein
VRERGEREMGRRDPIGLGKKDGPAGRKKKKEKKREEGEVGGAGLRGLSEIVG